MESSASLELAKHALLMFGIILGVGTFSGLIARLAKVPDVVVFLLVGMLIGPGVLGFVDIKADSTINQLILIFGASYILFDGGASIRLKVLKEVWITILVIATIGVLITAAITGIAAYYFSGCAHCGAVARRRAGLHRPGHTGAGVQASQDQGARRADGDDRIRLQRRDGCHSHLHHIRRGDGGGRVLGNRCVIRPAQAIVHRYSDWRGAGLSGCGVHLARETRLPRRIRAGGHVNGGDSRLHGGGRHACQRFMAVFVFGIMLGNQGSLGFKLTSQEDSQLEEYVMTTAFIMRMFIFILLGTQVDFGLMNQYLFSGVAVVVVFMLLARPATCFCAPCRTAAPNGASRSCCSCAGRAKPA